MRSLRNTPRSAKVFREDNVKDDNGYNAVCTEEGASPSQMEAARFLDTIYRLPGMVGAANDAVSAYTKVHMSDAPRLLRLLENMPTSMDTYHFHPVEDRTFGTQSKNQWFLLSETFSVTF